MQPRFLEKRVEILERNVEGLNELPARVEALEGQVSQLRTEMRSEFSAVRSEATAFREEMHREFVAVREGIRAGDEETRQQMHAMHEELVARITGGDEETRNFSRILHEETIQRIAVVAEGLEETHHRLRGVQEQVGGVREDLTMFRREVDRQFASLGAQLTRRQPRKKR